MFFLDPLEPRLEARYPLRLLGWELSEVLHPCLVCHSLFFNFGPQIPRLVAACHIAILPLWGVYYAQPHRTPPSNPPRPPLLRGPFGIDMKSNQEIDVESMLNWCPIDPWEGEGEADSRVRSGGSVPNNPLAILSLRYAISRNTFCRETSPPPNWCDAPRWHLVLHRHVCVKLCFASYRAMLSKEGKIPQPFS